MIRKHELLEQIDDLRSRLESLRKENAFLQGQLLAYERTLDNKQADKEVTQHEQR